MKHTVTEGQAPMALSRYLPRALPLLPPAALRRMIAQGQVKRDGVRLCAEDMVRAGDELTLYLPKGLLGRQGEGRRIPILYEDDNVLLLIKPQDISVHEDEGGGETVLHWARGHVAAGGGDMEQVALCHRLDHHTGGVLLLSKNGASHDLLTGTFRDRRVDKRYICQVVGTPALGEATLEGYLRREEGAKVRVSAQPLKGGQPIKTAYRVLEGGDIARLEVDLLTGRTHQIRAHLASIGHPVLGDDLYGDRACNRAHGVRWQRLWATRLTLYPGGHLAYLDGRAFEAEPPF